jgi:hypothetical protein
MKADGDADNTNRRSPLSGVMIAVLFLLVFYPLSAGPAVWLWSRGYVGMNTVTVAYEPLGWVYDASPQPVQKAFDAYLELW